MKEMVKCQVVYTGMQGSVLVMRITVGEEYGWKNTWINYVNWFFLPPATRSETEAIQGLIALDLDIKNCFTCWLYLFKINNLHLPDFLDFNLELHQFSLEHQDMLVEEISEMAAE